MHFGAKSIYIQTWNRTRWAKSREHARSSPKHIFFKRPIFSPLPQSEMPTLFLKARPQRLQILAGFSFCNMLHKQRANPLVVRVAAANHHFVLAFFFAPRTNVRLLAIVFHFAHPIYTRAWNVSFLYDEPFSAFFFSTLLPLLPRDALGRFIPLDRACFAAGRFCATLRASSRETLSSDASACRFPACLAFFLGDSGQLSGGAGKASCFEASGLAGS